jgi:hypothetical protein
MEEHEEDVQDDTQVKVINVSGEKPCPHCFAVLVF